MELSLYNMNFIKERDAEITRLTKQRDELVGLLSGVIECGYVPEPSLLTKINAALASVKGQP